MIDIHCHLLPGIDDGPKVVDEAIAMARMAVADGISRMVLTPHIHPGRWDNQRSQLLEEVDRLRCALRDSQIPLQVGLAAEVRLSDEIFLLLEKEHIPFYGCYDGYQLMLLELPHSHVPPGTENLVNWLIKQKIRPVIAHPERNKEVMKNPERVRWFDAAGCYFQFTAGAVVGRFGAKAEATVKQLLGLNLTAVLATDAHNTAARAPLLSEAKETVDRVIGEGGFHRMTSDLPTLWVSDQFPAKC